MNNEISLSICITSYNRINELRRCLESIDSQYYNEIEIVVSEDNSPLKAEIASVVFNYEINSHYKVIYNSNTTNLGYDNNLAKLIRLANGKYLMFISDDDCFVPHMLDRIIKHIKDSEFGTGFVPFYVGTGLKEIKRKYSQGNMHIEKGETSAGKFLYDSILFSGLIFDRKLAIQYSAENFKNYNYFQVYLFLSIIFKNGGEYIDIPSIICVSDGENAYGIADSSGGNELLSNRKSVFSYPEFHKGLIKTIKYFDNENGTRVIHVFEKEYSIRIYGQLSEARHEGLVTLIKYWKQVTKLDINLTLIAHIYYITLFVLGEKICNIIYSFPKKLLLRKRGLATLEHNSLSK